MLSLPITMASAGMLYSSPALSDDPKQPSMALLLFLADTETVDEEILTALDFESEAEQTDEATHPSPAFDGEVSTTSEAAQ